MKQLFFKCACALFWTCMTTNLFAVTPQRIKDKLNVLEKNLQAIDKNFNLNYLKKRIIDVDTDIQRKGLVYNKQIKDTLLTGYDYTQFYDWDLYFENIFQVYNGNTRFCFSNLKAFFAFQEKSGFIKRSFGTYEYGSDHMFKPFIAQIVYLGIRNNKDIDFLNNYYENIVRYEYAWYELFDKDKNLLCVWNDAAHSGMDNQTSRVIGGLVDEGVDLNCYLYREFKALAQLAALLNKKDDVKKFNKRASDIKEAINKYLWDDETGFYYDRIETTGQLNKVKGISGFIPLFAEIASPAKAKRLINEHLLSTNEFWSEYPICTLAMNEKRFNTEGSQPPSGYCNWNGTTWIPTNYMIFHGLMKYGYTDIAEKLAYKTFELVCLKNKPHLREYYNSQTGDGYGRNPFYGWSSLGYIMPLEFEFKYSPTDFSPKKISPIIEILKNTEIE